MATSQISRGVPKTETFNDVGGNMNQPYIYIFTLVGLFCRTSGGIEIYPIHSYTIHWRSLDDGFNPSEKFQSSGIISPSRDEK